jgi:hypothetical protein
MLGPLLVVMGLLGVYAFFKGRSQQVLDAITQNSFSASLDNALGNLNLGGGSSSGVGGSGSKSSGSGGGTSLFNVPIIDSSGGVGTIQVVAHDAASAIVNATQGGNTPTGGATSV